MDLCSVVYDTITDSIHRLVRCQCVCERERERERGANMRYMQLFSQIGLATTFPILNCKKHGNQYVAVSADDVLSSH